MLGVPASGSSGRRNYPKGNKSTGRPGLAVDPELEGALPLSHNKETEPKTNIRLILPKPLHSRCVRAKLSGGGATGPDPAADGTLPRIKTPQVDERQRSRSQRQLVVRGGRASVCSACACCCRLGGSGSIVVLVLQLLVLELLGQCC
jgi:hypothetical protein